MSNAGQALSAVAGAAIGFFIGGPQGAYYGFQLGYLAGTALFPTQLPHLQGPRIGDGQQTVSIIGQPIPRIFGTQTVGGNIIWASPIREIATTQDVGGKGGPEQSQTTYTYRRSFAILLCEGPIAGIRRAWANGKIIYDARARLPDEDDDTYLARQAANGDFLSRVTVYLGTEDQMPDPVIESFEGAGNVPAHRGYAYAVFDDVELKPEDGNRIPAQWKFEIYENGDESDGQLDLFSNSALFDWKDHSASLQDPRNTLNVHAYKLHRDGSGQGLNGNPPWRNSLEGALADVATYLPPAVFGGAAYILGWSLREGSENPNANLRPYSAEGWDAPNDRPNVFLHIQEASIAPAEIFIRLDHVSVVAPNCAALYAAGTLFGEYAWWSERYTNLGPDYFNLDVDSPLGYMRLADFPTTAIFPREIINNNCIAIPNVESISYSPDVFIKVKRVPQAPPDPADVGTPTGIPGWYVVDGQLLPAGAWEEVSGTFKVLQKFEENEETDPGYVRYPLNPCVPQGHDNYDDEAFWTNAYNIEVARGRMEAGLVYGVDYPEVVTTAYRKSIDTLSIDVQPISLGSIVSRICESVDLTEYDVTDLEERYVIGYQVSRPMAARAAIEPLRSVGFFDVVESVTELRFPVRGKAPVVTLSADDLGAHFETEERVSAVTNKRAQEVELPRQVRVHFQNPERGFDPGEELSPARFDTAAQSVLDIDLSVAITPDMAAQCAEVLLRDFWAGRDTYTTQVDQAHSAIEPADIALVPIDGRLERVRFPSVTDRLPNLRVLDLVRDDDGAYVSYAQGTTPQYTPPGFTFAPPADSVLLDLPALLTEHNDAGIYVVAYPSIVGGTFRGAVIARSRDGGAGFEPVGSVTEAGVVGTLLQDVTAGPTTIFDEGTEILVELRAGELEERDEEDVLAGANAAAVGANGRWEVVQFKHAELLAARIYRLSGLLRGRKGTEHAVGQAVRGDQFVMLSTGALGRLALGVADVHREMHYRVSPIGSTSSLAQAFTSRGVALKPYSPVHVDGVRDDEGALTITWVRRDRLASDDGTSVPMSEAIEDYEVDIIDTEGEVIRTISVSSPQAVYGVDEQITDFGDLQDAVSIVVYQVSRAVGRGYPAEAVV